MTKKRYDSIFLLPHYDDEFAFLEIINKKSKGKILIVYMTMVNNKKINFIRKLNSIFILYILFRRNINIEYLNDKLCIYDKDLINNLHLVYSYINFNYDWSSIYTTDCEGGHPDHDASFALGYKLSRDKNKELFSVPTYNYDKTKLVGFNVMTLNNIKKNDLVIKYQINILKGIIYALSVCLYISQFRTFIGLAPGIFKKYIFKRSICVIKRSNFIFGNKDTLLYQRYKLDIDLFYSKINKFIYE